MCEINKENLADLITEIVKDNKSFDCEYDFQFNLALKLRDKGYEVGFEKKIYSKDKRWRCDLELTKDNQKILIELKYVFVKGKQSKTSSYSARKSFVKDYDRILHEIKETHKANAGFVVFLTNKTSVYVNNEDSKENQNVKIFHNNFSDKEKWADCDFKEYKCKLLVVEVKDELKNV